MKLLFLLGVILCSQLYAATIPQCEYMKFSGKAFLGRFKLDLHFMRMPESDSASFFSAYVLKTPSHKKSKHYDIYVSTTAQLDELTSLTRLKYKNISSREVTNKNVIQWSDSTGSYQLAKQNRERGESLNSYGEIQRKGKTLDLVSFIYYLRTLDFHRLASTRQQIYIYLMGPAGKIDRQGRAKTYSRMLLTVSKSRSGYQVTAKHAPTADEAHISNEKYDYLRIYVKNNKNKTPQKILLKLKKKKRPLKLDLKKYAVLKKGERHSYLPSTALCP